MNILKKVPLYKILILGMLFEGKPLNTKKVHTHLIKEMNGKHPSRASVIIFLNKLVDHNHVTFEEVTGKGGYHRIYSLKGTPDDFTNRLTLQMNTQFSEEYLIPLEALS